MTTNVWSEAESIVFNEVDANGVLHNFGGIDSDHLLDVFNEGDSGYMVGDILTHGGGSFQFDLITSVGVAAGPASMKIFKAEGTLDVTNYIRKGTEESTSTEYLYGTRLKYFDRSKSGCYTYRCKQIKLKASATVSEDVSYHISAVTFIEYVKQMV